LIGQLAGADIGVVRFDISGAEAEVSIYVAPGVGGSGTGVELLVAAEAWLADQRPAVRTVMAEVLHDNQASHRMFESGGYTRRKTLYTKELQPQ
jgi:RimJ/RimL family protein N-acetyltransferase